MILSPDKEIARLMRFAIKLGIKNDEAWDLAADAYLSGLEHGCVDWHFTSICLKHSVLQYKRDRKRRNLDYQWTFREGEDEAEELRLLSCYPTQIAHVTAMSALRAIEALPEGYARVLRLAAQEYTADEIAAETGILKSEVYWRLREGRKTLRKKGFQEEKAFRGDSQFTGIKRDCRKWQASIRKGKMRTSISAISTPPPRRRSPTTSRPNECTGRRRN